MGSSQIIEIVATWLPALIIALSGVMKLSGAAPVKDTLRKMGVGQYLPIAPSAAGPGGVARPVRGLSYTQIRVCRAMSRPWVGYHPRRDGKAVVHEETQ
ncbi:MAG: hypothetical protein ABL971_10595 [Vicinamibacterales bacterium]